MVKNKANESSADLLQTLGDFTSKENWDKFFTIRGVGDSFEWYAEWPQLRDSILPLLRDLSADTTSSSPSSSSTLQILVPGCGNSRLSEHLYDAEFRSITNVDFSKVVISDMLRRNIRTRPEMRWRVMDMTDMQFTDETFDIVLDKGGLDALMEPEIGAKLGNLYLSEVRRVLKSGGKFICLTLAESHVLGLFFSRFRFGWKMTVHAVPQKLSGKPSLQTFMIVAEKSNSMVLCEIASVFNLSSLDCSKNQACGFLEALENENQIRREYYTGSDLSYSLDDLHLGVKGDLMKLSEGRRIKFILGSQDSHFSYKAMLFDARKQSVPFLYHCGVFLVPKNNVVFIGPINKVTHQVTRVHEWLFSSEDGQWLVVESSKAARLIMILLDSSHISTGMEDIQKDLSPLVKQLAPRSDDNEAQIPFMMAGDGIKQRKIVHQAASPLTGQVVVEDVIYESVNNDASCLSSSTDLTFRRLVFQRSEGLIQSEALLIKDEPSSTSVDEAKKHKAKSSSRSKRKGNQKVKDVTELSTQLQVCHGYLASSYHTGIISGFTLISSYLSNVASAGEMVKAVVVGLGAGLLPKFLHNCMAFIEIEVVELDPLMLTLAKDYFSFTQDEHLKVHIADGIKFIKGISNSLGNESSGPAVSEANGGNANENSASSHVENRSCSGFDVLIIDVDSSDSSSGMTCPAADFVEESFLLSVKQALPAHGLFVVNLVSRSSSIKDMVVSRIKKVFGHLCFLQLEEDVNLVLFGLCSEMGINEDCINDSALGLEKFLKCQNSEIKQSIVDSAKKITCWK